MTTTLIRGRSVICRVLENDQPEIITDGAVLVEDGVVVETGPYAAFAERKVDRLLGGPGQVVMPGFVNAHHHVGLTPLQLGSPDLPLELWFGSRLAARNVDLRLDTLYSAFEMVASGVTTVQHLQNRLPGPLEAMLRGASDTLRAYQDLGMRVSYGHGIRDQNRLVYGDDAAFLASLPEDLAARVAPLLARQTMPLEDNFVFFEEMRRRFGHDPRIAIQLAPASSV
jgi:cytosine/adenosine deaminase-related metal-dependent hydrolase